MTSMSMPAGIGAADLMIGFPSAGPTRECETAWAVTRDAASARMACPAECIVKRRPDHLADGADPVEVALGEMDRCGVAIGMVGNA